MKNLIYLSMSLLFVLASCAQGDTVKYTVASQTGDCVGVAPQQCLLIKKGDATEWEYFYSNIEGFNYESGYEYVLEVQESKLENVPADASSIKYVLVKEISKVAKTSENLPVPPASETVQAKYQFGGKVLSVEKESVGRSAAAGQFEVTVVKLRVTHSANEEIKAGDVVYCELIASPRVMPVVDREYIFKAKELHPAHAKGKYMLETDVMDLV